jgi:hypothetical protein
MAAYGELFMAAGVSALELVDIGLWRGRLKRGGSLRRALGSAGPIDSSEPA